MGTHACFVKPDTGNEQVDRKSQSYLQSVASTVVKVFSRDLPIQRIIVACNDIAAIAAKRFSNEMEEKSKASKVFAFFGTSIECDKLLNRLSF